MMMMMNMNMKKKSSCEVLIQHQAKVEILPPFCFGQSLICRHITSLINEPYIDVRSFVKEARILPPGRSAKSSTTGFNQEPKPRPKNRALLIGIFIMVYRDGFH